MEIWATLKSYSLLELTAMTGLGVFGVGDTALPHHLWSPSLWCHQHRGHGKHTDIRGLRFSRTHVYLTTLCVIFGARPGYRQITSSSVSLAWMCSRKPARGDAIFHDCSIIQVQWVKGKHHIEQTEEREKERWLKRNIWQTELVMYEEKRNKNLHSKWTTWDSVHARALILKHTLRS